MKSRAGILCLVILVIAARVVAEVYLWPFHGQRRLSSSFSEYRDGHYHAGIDLRSFGRVGLPCLAISDGCVSRIKIGPTGYGKALYLKLSDGNTAVYAHLDCFSMELDSMVWYHRLRSSESWCDIKLGKNKYCFSAGDTLCYSGQTGTTAPHLHFELRDEAQRPFNPLEEFYTMHDRASPIISGIEVIPRTEGSLVNGSPFPEFFLLRASGREIYLLADTLQLDGRFSFAVSTWDEQGYGHYRMGPYSIELRIDNRSLYSVRNSTFSYAQSGEVDLEYDIVGKGAAGRYSILYRKKGNSRSDRNGQGIIQSDGESFEGMFLEKGLHDGEIVVTDATGNTSRAHFVFKLHDYPVITEARLLEAAPEAVIAAIDPDGGDVSGRLFESLDGGIVYREIPVQKYGKFSKTEVSSLKTAIYRYEVVDDEKAVSVCYFGAGPDRPEPENAFCEMRIRTRPGGIVLDITTDRILRSSLTVARIGGSGTDTMTVYRSGPMEFSAVAGNEMLESGVNLFMATGTDYRGYPVNSVAAFRIYILGSGQSEEIMISDTLQARLEARSVRGKAACILRSVDSPGPFPSGLKAVTSVFSIEFADGLFRRPLRMNCGTDRKTGLFLWKNRKGWSCVGVPAMEGGHVDIRYPGMYVLFRDGLPPGIKHVELTDIHPGSGFFKPYICSLPVEENGSGIDPWSAEAFLDGKRMVCEWDEFRKRLYIPVPAFLEPKHVKLKVEISDRSGNRAVEEFGFMLK